MDDMLLWGRTKEEHGHHLSLLLARCLENNLKKWTFFQPEVRYLGHILSTEGLRLDQVGFPSKQLMQEETEQFQVNMLEYISASQQRLKELLAATNEDPALVKLRGYAETSWPEKGDVPENVRPYWSYKEELHTQEGRLFRSNKSPVQRLMGRQTRTLLPVPTSHLVPETVSSKAVHSRLQEIRQRQKVYSNRGTRHLPPLSPGQPVTTYDTLQRTWSPALLLRPADTPRSAILRTEDIREIRRTREPLRDLTTRREHSPTKAPEDCPTEDHPSQELRRSTRTRHKPCRYPHPERHN
ncbi:uncharacterized protein LOC144129615 [Amblyomma americanum]